jgi:hypothetical protein
MWMKLHLRNTKIQFTTYANKLQKPNMNCLQWLAVFILRQFAGRKMPGAPLKIK